MLRSVSRQEFNDVLADSAASPAFREVYARFVSFDDLLDNETMVHDGELRVQGSFRAPALCTMIAGCDVWASVGAGALMEYGVGYCLPIDYADAAAKAIEPQHDEDETVRIVTPHPKSEGYLFEADTFAELIRAGQPIFK